MYIVRFEPSGGFHGPVTFKFFKMDTAVSEKCVAAPSGVQHRPKDTVVEIVMPRPPSPAEECAIEINDTVTHQINEDFVDTEGLSVRQLLLL